MKQCEVEKHDFSSSGVCYACGTQARYVPQPPTEDITQKQFDPVDRPAHYNFGKIEVISVIEDWKLDYHRANVIKYLARAGRKDPTKEIEDLSKALWYLERYIGLKQKAKDAIEPPKEVKNG